MVQALFYNLPLTLKNFRLCCLNDSNRHHPLHLRLAGPLVLSRPGTPHPREKLPAVGSAKGSGSEGVGLSEAQGSEYHGRFASARTPSLQAVAKGRGFPIVTCETWTALKKFYRQLGALTEIEVLDLRIASKELEWLDESGQERQDPQNNSDDRDDTWRTDGSTRNSFHHPFQDHLKNALEFTHDKSFPGLLSLGDETIGRSGSSSSCLLKSGGTVDFHTLSGLKRSGRVSLSRRRGRPT
ncbi:hypothetical protein F5H01DRAFT_415311 [Linnemannia elongata]|nr:hypothetical protein F5H01DRAFT_415311 [Linnemannia elongata]